MPLRTTFLASTLVVATALSTFAVSDARAETNADMTGDAIAAAVPEDDPKPLVPIRAKDSYTVKKDGLSVSIPFDPATMVELKAEEGEPAKASQQGPGVQDTGVGVEVGSPGDSVGIGLPRTTNPTITTVQADGTVLYVDKLGPFDVAVQALEDGSARAMVVVRKPSAPKSYSFPVRLPAGGSLATDSDGGVLIKGADGQAIGAIAAPWATDANGVPIPTRFIALGNKIVQEVDHAGAAYPVVSDPKVSLCFHWGVRVCVKFNKTETRRIANVITQTGLKEGVAVLCGLLPNAPPVMIPIKIACAVAVARVIAGMANTFITAKNKGKCVRIRFLTTGTPVTWNVVTC